MQKQEQRELPKKGEIWRHFKNHRYEIITVARHTETRELYVVYKALYDDYSDYLRPLDMFMSRVDSLKYPDVQQTWRFEREE